MMMLNRACLVARCQSFARKSCSRLVSTSATMRTATTTVEDLMTAHTHPKLSYSYTTSKFPVESTTIAELIEAGAAEKPDSMIYGFPHQGMNLTFKELKQRVDVVSQNLLQMGFKKGDRVCFVLPNTIELAISFLGATQIGLIGVVLNPAYQLVELEYMLKKTAAKGIFIYDSFKVLQHLALIRKLCPELDSCEPGKLQSKNLPDLRSVIVLNSPLIPEKKTYKGTIPFSQVVTPKSSGAKEALPVVESDDPCFILFTSGTTGKPKGALVNHYGLINTANLSTRVVSKDVDDSLKMLCNPIPLFHIFGLATGLIIPLIMKTPLVFPFFFPDTLSTLKAIDKYGCNTMRGTPTQYVDLLTHPERKNFNLSKLENLIVGGSTVPPDLLAKLTNDLKVKKIIVGYGMTETSFCHTVTTDACRARSHKFAYESVGRQIPYTESKIIDQQTGNMVPLNTDGELCIRGYNVFKGYYNDPEKTAETIDKNGWLKTGDVASMDEHGYLYFKSRSKDVIIRGGANIYPAEVEAFLRTHPSVVDIGVFGVPDERMGEEIAAWVKIKPGTQLTLDEVKEFCKGRVSHFKVPKYLKIVEAFPINANNKVLKNVMQDQYVKELGLAK